MSNPKKPDRPILNGIYKAFVPDRSPYDIAVERHSRKVSNLRDEVRASSRKAVKISKQCSLDSELLDLQKLERTLVAGSPEMSAVQIKMSLIRFRMKYF